MGKVDIDRYIRYMVEECIARETKEDLRKLWPLFLDLDVMGYIDDDLWNRFAAKCLEFEGSSEQEMKEGDSDEENQGKET